MKPHVLTIASNSNKTISLDEIVQQEASIKLVIEPGAQVVCTDTRTISAESVEFSLIIVVQENGQLLYCDQRQFDDQAHVTSTITIKSERDSRVRFEQWQRGATNINTKIEAHLMGTNAEVNLRLGAQLSGEQKQKVQTHQHHQAAHTKSHCVVKSIISDEAQSLYDGIIQIDKDAVQSEAFQDHKALVMNDGAYAYARPSLQVQTDEVQCGHGSAIGQLDEEQFLYLQARGLSASVAHRVLTRAFFEELYTPIFTDNVFSKESKK